MAASVVAAYLLAGIAASMAIPLIPLTRTQYHAQDELGAYNFGFNTGDGQYRQETKDHAGNVIGRYGYIAPDGQRIDMAYTSNGITGYNAVGNAIPVAPGPVALAGPVAGPLPLAAPVAGPLPLAAPVAAHPYAYGGPVLRTAGGAIVTGTHLSPYLNRVPAYSYTAVL